MKIPSPPGYWTDDQIEYITEDNRIWVVYHYTCEEGQLYAWAETHEEGLSPELVWTELFKVGTFRDYMTYDSLAPFVLQQPGTKWYDQDAELSRPLEDYQADIERLFPTFVMEELL